MAQKSLKINALYSVIKVFLSLVFPLITFPYASRILLPEGIGKVNFANSVCTYFIMLASLGIGMYASREAAKIRDDKKALTKLFKEIITINIVCCIVAYVLFFIALFCIPKLSNYRNLLLICSVKILFALMGIEWIYLANEEFKFITIRTAILQLISLLYLFTFVKTEDDIIHYAIFGIFTSTGSNFLNFFFVGKYLDFSYKPKLEYKKHIKGSFIFFGMTVVTSIYTMLDTSMLGFLSNDTQVGYYTASTKLSHMVLNMLTAITTVLLPRLTNYAQNGDYDKFEVLIKKSANILLLLSIPMTMGLIILSKPLIILLSGEQYIPAIPSMKLLSPILIIISFGSLIGSQLLPAINKEKISFYSYTAGAITNVIFNSIFIPKFGALGAAIGTISAETVVTSTQAIYARHYIFSKDFFLNLIQVLFASFAMVYFILFLQNKTSFSVIIEIFISFFSGIIIYSTCLLLMRNKTFIFYLKKILKMEKN